MARRNQWRIRIAGWCLVGVSFTVVADPLDAQRQRYQAIKQAWDSNDMATVAHLLPTLQAYPLYPYLQYRWLTQDMSLLSVGSAQAFISAHPTLPPARKLVTRLVNELARRQDWKTLLSFSPQPPEGVEARCHYHYAQWATGQASSAWQGAASIWLTGKSLPASCDRLFAAWQDAGKQTAASILTRLRLAFESGDSGLITHLVRQLPRHDTGLGRALLALQRNPASIDDFARTIGPNTFSREITTIAFNRLARQNAEKARSLLPGIVNAQQMSTSEQLTLEESIAWRWMGTRATAEQAAWRDQVAARSHNEALLERRVRMALGEGNRSDLATWLAKLPAEAQHKDQWVYWRATLMLEGKQPEEGKRLLRSLIKKRGFYPMAAAQKLKVSYPLTVNRATRPTDALIQRPEIARVRELIYWQQDHLARSEWHNLVKQSPPVQQEALARYAFEQHWAVLSVQATIVAKLWDHLEERFPLAWDNHFRQMTEDKGISQSYAMAIARQESAWDPQAQSPVGASGLMQIMPKTAEHIAKSLGITRYTHSSQLLDPMLNIEMGTGYLEQMYQTFGGNRIFASAAYNAGPSRVNAWLSNSAGRLDAIAFIESIPFAETRGYVKNVLAYDLFYCYLMQRPLTLLTKAEWGHRY